MNPVSAHGRGLCLSVRKAPEKKTEPEVKNPQVSVYNFAEIMKEKKAEERAATPSGEKPDPTKADIFRLLVRFFFSFVKYLSSTLHSISYFCNRNKSL